MVTVRSLILAISLRLFKIKSCAQLNLSERERVPEAPRRSATTRLTCLTTGYRYIHVSLQQKHTESAQLLELDDVFSKLPVAIIMLVQTPLP